MSIREKAEYWGYKLFLSYDMVIQYEFHKEKKQLKKASYFSKLKLLLKIIFDVKVLGISEIDRWNKRQSRLFYPEWDRPVSDQYRESDHAIQNRKVIALDIWYTLVFPLLGDLDMQKEFSDEIADITDDFLENTRLIEAIKGAEQEKIYMIYCRTGEKELAEKIIEKNGLKNAVICRAEDLDCIANKSGEAADEEQVFYIRSSHNESKSELPGCIYPDVQGEGKMYRPYSGYNPVTQIYNSILCARFQCGADAKLDYFYGMGYKYGGILTAGICQWLNETAKLYDIDKIVFLSRDCDVISQAYHKWFGQIDSMYMRVSRRALSEAMFCESPEAYINNVIVPKMTYEDENVTVSGVLDDLGIEIVKPYLKMVDIREDQRLDNHIREKLVQLFQMCRADIEKIFLPYREAALSYLSEVFSEEKRILILDVGWKGTIFQFIKKLGAENGWKAQIKGALVAAMDSRTVANLVSTESIVTYLFDNERVQNFKKKKGIPFNNCQVKCFETMFSSPEDSLTHYELAKDGGVEFICRDNNANSESIKNIHRGILDFLADFLPYITQNHLKISAKDAYEPFSGFLDQSKMVKSFIEHLKSGSRQKGENERKEKE